MVKLGPSIMLKDGIFVLITSVVEFRAHFSKFMSLAHDYIVIMGELFNLIRVSFGVQESNRSTLSKEFIMTTLEVGVNYNFA